MILSVYEPNLTTQEMLFNDYYKMNLQRQLYFTIWLRGMLVLLKLKLSTKGH